MRAQINQLTGWIGLCRAKRKRNELIHCTWLIGKFVHLIFIFMPVSDTLSRSIFRVIVMRDEDFQACALMRTNRKDDQKVRSREKNEEILNHFTFFSLRFLLLCFIFDCTALVVTKQRKMPSQQRWEGEKWEEWIKKKLYKFKIRILFLANAFFCKWNTMNWISMLTRYTMCVSTCVCPFLYPIFIIVMAFLFLVIREVVYEKDGNVAILKLNNQIWMIDCNSNVPLYEMYVHASTPTMSKAKNAFSNDAKKENKKKWKKLSPKTKRVRQKKERQNKKHRHRRCTKTYEKWDSLHSWRSGTMSKEKENETIRERRYVVNVCLPMCEYHRHSGHSMYSWWSTNQSQTSHRHGMARLNEENDKKRTK